MKKNIFLLIAASATVTLLNGQVVMPLYDEVPNSKPSPNRESTTMNNGSVRISGVSIPGITRYTPAVANDKHTAIIICPGGGYARLAAGHEGADIARLLNEWGITAFVLKYRLPDDSIMVDKSIGPLQDAQRSLQLVRENATKWNIDPARIGIMGFSAGGHLASTASTHFDKPVIENGKAVSLRPDFSILVYPVISFADSLMHAGSRDNLIGKNPLPEKILAYSSEKQVTAKTPPAFLVHAGDDKTVKAENSILYYEALLKYKTRAELHLYQGGGHGFGLNNSTTQDKWSDRLKNWLTNNGYL